MWLLIACLVTSWSLFWPRRHWSLCVRSWPSFGLEHGCTRCVFAVKFYVFWKTKPSLVSLSNFDALLCMSLLFPLHYLCTFCTCLFIFYALFMHFLSTFYAFLMHFLCIFYAFFMHFLYTFYALFMHFLCPFKKRTKSVYTF